MTPDTLFDLGVQSGTNAALFHVGLIGSDEYWDVFNYQRITYGPEPHAEYLSPYWEGYNAAYANAMRPEVLAIFQEGRA